MRVLQRQQAMSREVCFTSRRGYSGVATVEYALIATCLIAFCFYAFSVLGSAFAKSMTAARDDMKTHSASASVVAAQEKALQNLPGASGSSSGTFSPSTLYNGTSGGLSTMVETTGANGATLTMVNQLQNLAASLLASHSITQAEADKIIALANQGLRMAQLEKQIEDASKTGDVTSFLGSTVTLDGQVLSVSDAANLLGFSSANSPVGDLQGNSTYMLTNDSGTQPETKAFLSLYQDVMSSPDLQSDEAKEMLTALTSQISYLSDTTSNLVNGAILIPNVTLEELQQGVISDSTTYDSKSICALGNSTSCQPATTTTVASN